MADQAAFRLATTMSPMTTPYRYVALGDSFTEGVGDDAPDRPNGLRGWADRVAEGLSASRQVEYSNLAIRGWLLDQIVDTQLAKALDLNPDLITISAGGNDMLRPGFDVDATIERYDALLTRLGETNAHLVVFTMPSRSAFSALEQLEERKLAYTRAIRAMAADHGATLVDFYSFDGFDDPRMWSWDRIHLSAAGHQRMAVEVLDVLGVDHGLSKPALGQAGRRNFARRRADDVIWAGKFLLPWIGRRVRGTSSGFGVTARYPEYVDAATLR